MRLSYIRRFIKPVYLEECVALTKQSSRNVRNDNFTENANLSFVTPRRHSFVLRPFDWPCCPEGNVFIAREDSVFRRRRLSTVVLPSHDSKILSRTFRSSRCQRLNHPINTPRSVQFHIIDRWQSPKSKINLMGMILVGSAEDRKGLLGFSTWNRHDVIASENFELRRDEFLSGKISVAINR